MRFEQPNAIALFVEGRLRVGPPLFQPKRNGRLPLIGGGDFQSLVVHVVLRATSWLTGIAWGDGVTTTQQCADGDAKLAQNVPHCNRGGSRNLLWILYVELARWSKHCRAEDVSGCLSVSRS